MDTGIYFDSCWKARLFLQEVKEGICNTHSARNLLKRCAPAQASLLQNLNDFRFHSYVTHHIKSKGPKDPVAIDAFD